MATAEASISLDVSGLESGTQRAEAASARLLAADKRVKEQVNSPIQAGGTSVSGIDWFAAQRKAAERHNADMSRIFQKAPQIAGGHAGGHAGGSSTRVVGDLINMGTASTGAGMRVSALMHTLGLSAMAAASVVAVAAAFAAVGKAVIDARVEAEKFNRETRETQNAARGMGGVSKAGFESRYKSLEENSKKTDEAMGTDQATAESWDKGTWKAIYRRVVNSKLVGGKGVDARDQELQSQKAEDEKLKRQQVEGLKGKTMEEADITHLSYTKGAYAAGSRRRWIAAGEEQRKFREGHPGENNDMGIQARTQEEDAAAYKPVGLAKSLAETESRIVDMKREGGEIATHEAELRLVAAKTEAAYATDEEKPAADAKVAAAQLAVDLANQETRERKVQFEGEKANAQLMSSSDSQHRQQLQNEVDTAKKLEAEAQKLTHSEKDRENAAIATAKAELALKEDQLRVDLKMIQLKGGIKRSAANLAVSNSTVGVYGDPRAIAQAGGGYESARLEAEQADERVKRERQENIGGKRKASNEAIAAQIEAYDKLSEAGNKWYEIQDEINFRNKQTMLGLKSENIATRESIAGYGLLAQITRERSQAEAAAAQARRDGRPEEATQILGNQHEQELGERFDAEGGEKYYTGAGRRKLLKEQRAADKRNRAFQRFKATDGLVNVERDMNGNITSGYDPITRQHRAPTMDGSTSPTEYNQPNGGGDGSKNGVQLQQRMVNAIEGLYNLWRH